jgi:superfamily II DNA helicase RecQ
MSDTGHNAVKTKGMTLAENEEIKFVRVDGGSVDPATTLRTCFGFSEFRPGQRAVVEAVLGGRDAAVFSTTASGKSMCYQV